MNVLEPQELFPGSFKPTPAHHFMALMHKKGLLLRCFTQNIDSLESQAGLPAEKVVAAHGRTFQLYTDFFEPLLLLDSGSEGE